MSSLLLLSPVGLLCLSILASLSLIIRFLIFLPSGTLVWLGAITADSCYSGDMSWTCYSFDLSISMKYFITQNRCQKTSNILLLNSLSSSPPIHIISVMYSKLIRICKSRTTFSANIVLSLLMIVIIIILSWHEWLFYLCSAFGIKVMIGQNFWRLVEVFIWEIGLVQLEWQLKHSLNYRILCT